MNRKGFSIYLTFLVTTIVFLMVTGNQEISMLTLDMSRSEAIDVITYHAADGGLERGLAKINKNSKPFSFTYTSALKPNRQLKVIVTATINNSQINLSSEAILSEGNKEVSRRILSRSGITKSNGTKGYGKFMEAT